MHRPDASDEPITVGAYLREWLELQRHRLQPTTIRSYTGNIERYLEPHLGDIPLHELGILQLERCWARLMSEGGKDGRSLSRRTVEQAAATLRSALSDGVRTGLLERNVAKLARLPTVDPYLDDTDDETIPRARFAAAGLTHLPAGTQMDRQLLWGAPQDGRTTSGRWSHATPTSPDCRDIHD